MNAQETEFKAIVVGKDKVSANSWPSYNYLRLCMYPSINVDSGGSEGCKAVMILKIDGNVTDIIEQRQSFSADSKVDVLLARYMFLLNNYDEDEYHELLVDYPDNEIHKVTVSIRIELS